MAAMVTVLHLGALHPVEALLTAALALAPFAILAVVVTVVSRRDRRQATRAEDDPAGVDRAERDDTRSTTTDTAAPQSVQQ
jgi:membrane protein implicated in regulation of membrane protease activity